MFVYLLVKCQAWVILLLIGGTGMGGESGADADETNYVVMATS